MTNVDGLPTGGTGRVGFRYYVHGVGPLGANSSCVGIDRVAIESGVQGGLPPAARELPSLGTIAMIGMGGLRALFGFTALRRRRSN